jgi:glycosyltransferase involved in cell wall biosynthesis
MQNLDKLNSIENTELISVICPIYNAHEYINYSIKSLIKQSYNSIEIIIVDDGSTDDSVKLIDDLNDKRIKIISKPNGGKNAALNHGLKFARGQYLYFFDQDDYIPENYLESLYKNIKQNQVDISISGYEIVTKSTMLDRFNQPKDYQSLRVYYKESILKAHFKDDLFGVVLWNKLFRRHILDSFEFNERFLLDDLPSTYILLSKATSVSLDVNLKYYHIRHNSSKLANIEELRPYAVESLEIYSEMIVFFDNENYSDDIIKSVEKNVLMPITLSLSFIVNTKVHPSLVNNLVSFIWRKSIFAFRHGEVFMSFKRLLFILLIVISHKFKIGVLSNFAYNIGKNYSIRIKNANLRKVKQ